LILTENLYERTALTYGTIPDDSFRFQIKDEIKAARKRRRRRIRSYAEEPMTQPTKIAL
jgi:hypothetical protein